MSTGSAIEPLKDVLPQGKERALEALATLEERASQQPGALDPAVIAAVVDWMRKVVVAQYAVEEGSEESTTD